MFGVSPTAPEQWQKWWEERRASSRNVRRALYAMFQEDSIQKCVVLILHLLLSCPKEENKKDITNHTQRRHPYFPLVACILCKLSS